MFIFYLIFNYFIIKLKLKIINIHETIILYDIYLYMYSIKISNLESYCIPPLITKTIQFLVM